MSHDKSEGTPRPVISKRGLATISAVFGAFVGCTLSPRIEQLGERLGGITGIAVGTVFALLMSGLVAGVMAWSMFRKE